MMTPQCPARSRRLRERVRTAAIRSGAVEGTARQAIGRPPVCPRVRRAESRGAANFVWASFVGVHLQRIAPHKLFALNRPRIAPHQFLSFGIEDLIAPHEFLIGSPLR